MNQDSFIVYSDYLCGTFGKATATGVAVLLVDGVSHDVAIFFAEPELTSRVLWRKVKPLERQIEAHNGVPIFDDNLQAKPYMGENDLIAWAFDHTTGRAVKGINQLDYLYHAGGVSLPVVFELVRKDAHFYNLQTRQERRDWSEHTAFTGWLKGVAFPILLPLQVFNNKDNSCGMLYLVCSQLNASWNDLTTPPQQQWQVEVFDKLLRSGAIFTKPPAHRVQMQANHLFASIVAVTKLKALNIHTMLNYFALHAKLNRKATRMAFDELQVLMTSE